MQICSLKDSQNNALQLYEMYESVKAKLNTGPNKQKEIGNKYMRMANKSESRAKKRERENSAKKQEKEILFIDLAPPEKVVDSSYYDEDDPDLAIFKKIKHKRKMTEMNEDIDNQIIDVKTDVHTQNLFGDPSQNVYEFKRDEADQNHVSTSKIEKVKSSRTEDKKRQLFNLKKVLLRSRFVRAFSQSLKEESKKTKRNLTFKDVQFNPEEFGLTKDFRLTRFAKLKGCGCKVPQGQLFEYLKDIGDGSIGKETPDCSVTKYVHDDSIRLISTIDFFYPLIENPYLQGKVACANVLSDIYAMGTSRIDHVLMVLAVSLDMNAIEREVVTREMIKGFNDACTEAGTLVTGGQSILGPWPMIGGVANTVVRKDEYLTPNNAKEGDIIVLKRILLFIKIFLLSIIKFRE